MEDKLTSIRSTLLHIINNWQRSGNGDGALCDCNSDESDKHEGMVISVKSSGDFSSLKNRSPAALASHTAFLVGKAPYHLYFWEMCDELDLLKSALQRLDDLLSASDGLSAPSAMSSSRKKARKEKDNEEFIKIVKTLGRNRLFD